MITASHLPFQRNGFKFFTAAGGAEHADINEVLGLAAQAAASAGVPPDNEFLGTAYVLTLALNVPAGLVTQVRCSRTMVLALFRRGGLDCSHESTLNLSVGMDYRPSQHSKSLLHTAVQK